MTATATDTITVSALDRHDAPDIARRQWEGFGFRVLRILDVTPGTHVGQWRVTADVEVIR